MKNLICALAAVAIMTWTSIPAQAEYLGKLPPGGDWVLEVTNSSNDSSVVTVSYLRRNLTVIEVLIVPPGGFVQQTFSAPGTTVKLVIIEVDTPPGGRNIVGINQSAPINCDGSRRLVLEVAG